jgi:hypothetical protein
LGCHLGKRFYTLRANSPKAETDRQKPVRSKLKRPPTRLLLASSGWNFGVFLLETLDTAGGVYEFLLAGEEWVAIGADFDTQHIALDGRARLESIPAGTMDGYGMIVGVDTGFHDSPFCRGRSARLSGRDGEITAASLGHETNIHYTETRKDFQFHEGTGERPKVHFCAEHERNMLRAFQMTESGGLRCD